MKKILSATCAMMLASAGMMANAQQLPNVGFKNWKTTNGTTILTSTDSEGSQVRPGEEPDGWNASNIKQLINIETLCEKKEDSGNVYVQLKNAEKYGNIVPAYLTIGTPWVFAHGTIFTMQQLAKYGDGGSFSGVDFGFKPDAISFKYRKIGGTGETSHVIAYLWNGSFSSNVPSKVTMNGVYTYDYSMNDVDRVVVGNQNDENVTAKGKLIASLDFNIAEDKQNWTSEVVEFKYVPENLNETPSKMNVIISASDYWTRSNLKGNTQLDIDDVKFVYYSRLKSLKLNEVEIEGFSPDVYEYTVEGTKEVYFGSELMSQFTTAKTEVHYNDYGYPKYATILVGRFAENGELLSGEYKDVDDATSHEYRINFSYHNSRLASLKVNDAEVKDFNSNTYSYYVAGEVPAIEKVEAVAVDPEATIEMTRDEETATITIVVTNPKGVDEDGESSHTYVLNFQKFYTPVGPKYDGTLTIQLEGGDPTEMPEQSVYIDVKEDGTCTFGLYQFALAPGMVLGDIVVENVTMGTDENGNTTYNGEKKDIVLFLDGSPIFADATVTGTEDAAGNLKMTIPVIWKTGIGDAAPMMTINVTFDGQKEGTSGVESVAGDGVKVYAAAGCVVVEGAEGVAQVYTADGKQVAAEAVNGKAEIALANGLYIVRVGNKVQKVVVK